jgi:hypothetical protein
MTMTMHFRLFATAALALCSSPAMAQDDESGDEVGSGQDRVCVSVRAIRSFDAFDDEHLYVREGGSGHYLFKMRIRCPGLRHAFGIAIKDITTRVCSDSFGEVVYRDRSGGQRLQSCQIGEITKVDSKDAAEALAQGGNEASGSTQDD